MFWLCWGPRQTSAHAVKVDSHFRRFVQPVRFCRDIHRRGQPFATVASPGSGGPAAGATIGLRESSKVFPHLDLIPRRELRWSDTVPDNCSGIQAIRGLEIGSAVGGEIGCKMLAGKHNRQNRRPEGIFSAEAASNG